MDRSQELSMVLLVNVMAIENVYIGESALVVLALVHC